MGKPHKYSLTDIPSTNILTYGILSDEKDYRLCWLLNKAFGLSLTRQPDLPVATAQAPQDQAFSCFESKGSADKPLCRLVSNRSREGLWLTEHRQLDYIMLIRPTGEPCTFSENLKKTLTIRIPEIRGLFGLDGKALANLL